MEQYLPLIIGLIASLIIVLVLMPVYIKFLKKVSYNQSVSEYSLQEYKEKDSTPTMGGLVFVLVPVIVLFVMFPNFYKDLQVFLVVFAYLGYGLIGFIDDFIIVIKRNNNGLPAIVKFLMQLALAMIFYFIYKDFVSTDLWIPVVNIYLPLGGLYALFAFIMFTGESNAVNLTDGMDGLAGGCSVLALIPFVYFAFSQHQIVIATFLMCIIGALFGYLRYNVFPAKIFMGDTGSLALGGVLAAVAMILKVEVLLLIVGGVFLWETLCVVIQITSVKLTGKRVFRYTPIHYSFVIGGMREPKVVQMFWMIGFICALLGFIIGVI